MAKIGVIIGSIREGRVSDQFAKWVAKEASAHASVEIIDLKEYPLPLFDEAAPPRYNPDRQPKPEVKKWLDKLAQFDGYILVTPEYNRAMPGALKNALDSVDYQIDKKPVALVGHGSSGGAQAIANLRASLPGIGAVTVPEALFFSHKVRDVITPEHELAEELKQAPYGPAAQLASVVTSLVWYTDALKRARDEQ